jgi:hypothetical protein
VDSQPETQRSSQEKTKYKHTVSNPNYSTGLGWKLGKRGRAPPFIGETLTSPLHGRADALPWPRDACPRASAGTRGHGPARTCERATSAQAFVHARADARARLRVKPRPRINADVRGRPDEKDFRMDIFIQKRPL